MKQVVRVQTQECSNGLYESVDIHYDNDSRICWCMVEHNFSQNVVVLSLSLDFSKVVYFQECRGGHKSCPQL